MYISCEPPLCPNSSWKRFISCAYNKKAFLWMRNHIRLPDSWLPAYAGCGFILDRWNGWIWADRNYFLTRRSTHGFFVFYPYWFITGRGSSIGSEFAWHASGPKFSPHVRHILSWRLGHENISTAILPLPLIQEEQLSVTGERMCTKYW